MKVSRQKHVRKVLNFYKHNFGYQPPFIVLIDGTFCKSALKFQVNISEQLPKYLQAETKLCTTACVKAECEALGKAQLTSNYLRVWHLDFSLGPKKIFR